MADGLFGPTLLDMRDIYLTEISTITLVIILKAVGSIIGAFSAGVLLDKCDRFRLFILFAFTLLLSLFTMILPHLSYLWIFFVISTLSSFASGALDTGGNVLCLNIWSDSPSDAGPFMHSIHFSFAIGAFLAPLIAIPFLGNTEDAESLENVSKISDLLTANNSVTENMVPPESKITILYPLVGLFGVLCSIGYLIFGLMTLKESKTKQEKDKDKTPPKKMNLQQWALVVIMMSFFFFYVGSEVCYGNYLATFAVESQLKLSKQTGAKITAVFWGLFATMRFLSIFAAIYLKPLYIMFLSCILSCLGNIMLAAFANTSVEVLWVGSGLVGFGYASIYATGFLWLEGHVKVTNKIGAALSIASSMGADVFPVIGGQLIETFPMSLMYSTCLTTIFCFIMFTAAVMIGKRSKAQHESEAKHELEKLEPNE